MDNYVILGHISVKFQKHLWKFALIHLEGEVMR